MRRREESILVIDNFMSAKKSWSSKKKKWMGGFFFSYKAVRNFEEGEFESDSSLLLTWNQNWRHT